jgi:hypothetical protein
LTSCKSARPPIVFTPGQTPAATERRAVDKSEPIHPAAVQLRAFALGQFGADALLEIAAHLSECQACCARLDQFRVDLDPRAMPQTPPRLRHPYPQRWGRSAGGAGDARSPERGGEQGRYPRQAVLSQGGLPRRSPGGLTRSRGLFVSARRADMKECASFMARIPPEYGLFRFSWRSDGRQADEKDQTPSVSSWARWHAGPWPPGASSPGAFHLQSRAGAG